MALAATRLIPMRKNKGKSIGACRHEAKEYKDNWRWLMFRSGGRSYASDNALHYVTVIYGGIL